MRRALGVPSLDNDPADPAWTAEIGTGDEDSTMSFGKRELFPHPLAKRLKVSNKFLRSALMSPDAIVRERLAYKFAVTEENNFLNGNGADEPLGVFTASDDGISTGQDVATDNAATYFTQLGLKSALYNLPAQYRNSPDIAWVFHRDGVAMTFKMVDGNQAPIWEPSLKVGAPDMLLGKPIYESEYAPNTFTTGLYAGIIGDFSYYWIADALGITIQVLTELYAESNQTGYFARAELDAMPVLEAAFTRVKLG